MTWLHFLPVREIAEVQEKCFPIIKSMVLGTFSVQQWINVQMTEKLELMLPGLRIHIDQCNQIAS